MYRILVAGGRDYGVIPENATSDEINIANTQREKLYSVLDTYFANNPEMLIIQGGAKGADFYAKYWASVNKVEYKEYRAEWGLYGKTAGYYRNLEMLEDGEPDLVLLLKGGAGTRMMLNLCKKTKTPYKEIK